MKTILTHEAYLLNDKAVNEHNCQHHFQNEAWSRVKYGKTHMITCGQGFRGVATIPVLRNSAKAQICRATFCRIG